MMMMIMAKTSIAYYYIVLRTLHIYCICIYNIVIYSILPTTLQNRYNFHLCTTDEKNEAQRSRVFDQDLITVTDGADNLAPQSALHHGVIF